TVPQNSSEPKQYSLPIFTGTISGLPKEIGALIVTSDLQGVVPVGDVDVLLGEVLVDTLSLLFAIYYPALDKKSVIGLLCGDLYANKIKRGESGNPISVWRKFSAAFGWVVGIAGNHDDFTGSVEELAEIPNARFLVHNIVELEGLQIG